MPDKVVLDSYYGDVLLISGKCWFYTGATSATQTGHIATSAFTSCNECLTGLPVPFSPPSGASMSLGDCHYVYGIPATIATDPTSASLNVDDNSSNNEIVWWTHTEGGVEYVIKYSQQDFAFTAGGKSIDEIIVSASDLSVVDTYTVASPTQSATLRNGISWINGGVSGLGTAMSYNITERIIDPTDCCNIQATHFGLFNLQVYPANGFDNIEEYGGALWYIWKRTSLFGVGAVNTASSAGMDGVGLFLSGMDGYNARSQFEVGTNYASVRENYNQTDVTNVMSKLDELASINGYWDADWDPLVNDPLDCQMASCIANPLGLKGSDPTVFMTISWTDSDLTKTYVGCTWCNGETKEVFSSDYNGPLNTTTTTLYNEQWRIQNHAGNHFQLNANGGFSDYSTTTCPGNSALVHLSKPSDPAFGSFRHNVQAKRGGFPCSAPPCNVCTGFINQVTNCTIVNGPLSWSLDNSPRIKDAQFTSITTSNGVTIAWARGNGW